MPEPIDFYYDYSSPYAYLASEKIAEIADRHGRSVRWFPILLGAIMKVTHSSPPLNEPLKGAYMRRDISRMAQYLGVVYQEPTTLPIFSLLAARATYWVQETAPDQMVPFAQAVFRGFFQNNQDITDVAVLQHMAAGFGMDAAALAVGIVSQPMKDKVHAATDTAVKRGVFGAPYFIVEGEPFWGVDRLPLLDAWLSRGGW
jgi:2-hydroxychromene-2-carboxylate isomerase